MRDSRQTDRSVTDWIFILSNCFAAELRVQNGFQRLGLPFPKYWVTLGGCMEKAGGILGANCLFQDKPLTVLLQFVV